MYITVRTVHIFCIMLCDVNYVDYFRTLLFLWPKSQDVRLAIKCVGIKGVASDLDERVARYEERIGSGGSIESERKELANFVAAILSTLDDLKDPSPCLDSIAGAALVLEDANAFLRVAKKNSSHKISVPNWIHGVQLFSFKLLRESYVPFILIF